MNTYQPVFDANYYYMNNPDLQSVVGLDSQKLFEHFYTCGMAEGRRASENLCAEWAVGKTGLQIKIGNGRENHALVSQR